MKKYIISIFFLGFAITTDNVSAQDFDNNPMVQIDNEKKDLHFTIGARMMADAAYYHSDFTPVKSGAAISDARIRTSMAYDNWYFYADFDFSKGKFKQKHIFLQYLLKNNENEHSIKAGYYTDPASMAQNTSIGSYHFLSRAGASNTFAAGRELGITYKFTNRSFFANQGVFAENPYNDQIAGYQGVTLSGRWLFKPINDDQLTLHIGASVRYAHLGTGEVFNNTLKKTLILGQALETSVDPTTAFVSAELPWANNVLNVGAEALFKTDKFFIRGEYIFKNVTKKRDDQTLFEANLGSIDSWGTLESWQAGNPIGTNKFHGAYVETGFMIFGNPYKYNNAEGLLSGLSGKSLEIVARYNYTGLNDIVKGEYYSLGRDQYYPDGLIGDWPATSKSIGGGNIHSITVGANYSFNNYVQLMLSYSYNKLERDKYPLDKNFHTVQSRLIFTF